MDIERHLPLLSHVRNVARKSRAARSMGAVETPVSRTGNNPGRTSPSARSYTP